MKLVSTETGEVIWRYNGTLKVDTSGDSGGGSGITDLIIQAATTAVKTGLTDYVPIAKKANIKALVAIPYGKYHRKHLKDGTMKAINKMKVNEMDKRESGSK